MVTIKDLKESIAAKKVSFGLKEALKNKVKKAKIYVVSDAREETLKKLKEKGIEFETMKKKEDVAKELGLGFEAEVFLVK